MDSERTMKPLPEALAGLLELRGMTQTELAAAAGVTPATVSYYLSGERGKVLTDEALETLSKFSVALSVSPTFFAEVRRRQIEEAFAHHAELERIYYDQIMALAADFEELAEQQSKGVGNADDRSRSKRARRHPGPKSK